jgi:hypothetical protein
MKFAITIPDPDHMRVGKEDYVSLPGGTELHRIHPNAFGAAQFNDTDRGNARFSPIRSAAGAIIPTIYGAQSFGSAASEVILRCADVPTIDPATGLPPFQIVYPADYRNFSHSVVRTTADLSLVNLTVTGQRKVGVNGNALLAGPSSTYPATRAWAERIHAACPSAQGIYYSSYQYGPDFAVVLFGDRIPPGTLLDLSSRAVPDSPCHDEVRVLASSLSIEYEDV